LKEKYRELSYKSKIDIAALSAEKSIKFNISFSAEDLSEIATSLDVNSIKKATMRGKILRIDKDKWTLNTVIGATVLQNSVVSLRPVMTRIDNKVSRQLVKGPDMSIQKNERELNDDDFIDKELCLGLIFFEYLALTIPLYPKEKDEVFAESSFTHQEKKEDAESKKISPFAILAKLKKKDSNL